MIPYTIPYDSPSHFINFGALLLSIRKQAKLSQVQISALLNISRQAYSSYERSERAMPDEIWNRIPQVIPLTSDELTQIQAIRLNLTNEEKDLLSGFRRLDETQRKQILQDLLANVSS